MNDPFNSQEPAQTRHAYRSVTAKLGLLGLDTAIPERVRNLADKTVGKTREIFDHSVSAFEASVATFERSFDVPAKVRRRSISKSSTSPDAMSRRGSTWPRAWQAPRISPTW